ncbi:monocarboxylate transporter 2 isoform X2 [Nilaparvata lugens]|uniref:monocarboxylate transporter 2 isoform X2 n=1 Tax=Nilaparvata lugens TaxID=108931 RepID=UPI00193D301E|nr:monocarboxylate transporter 2 isoform X2 [Nilaparvata lugens]
MIDKDSKTIAGHRMPDVGCNGKEMLYKDADVEDEKKEQHKREEDDNNERGEEEEEEEEEEDEGLTALVAVPPDGGWGWVVVFASFFCNALVDGLVFSFGAFLSQIPESLNESKAAVSLIGSLLSGFYLIAGPVASALANRYGFRSVTVVGSAIACTAFAISSISNSVASLCFWYGLVGGLGFGLIYVPAVISVGFYFERWRALATGIAMCGSGIGTFVLAPFTTYLLQEIGWRGTMLIQAGLILNCAIFGLLFRPLKPRRVPLTDDVTRSADDQQTTNDLEQTTDDLEQGAVPLLMRIKMARQLQQARQRNDSTASSCCLEHELFVSDANAHNRMLNNNSVYPTIKQVLDGSYDSLHMSAGNLKLHPRLDAVLLTSANPPPPPIYPESITGELHKPQHEDGKRGRSLTPTTETLLGGNGNNMYKAAVISRQLSITRRSSSVGPGVRSRAMSNSSATSCGRVSNKVDVGGGIRSRTMSNSSATSYGRVGNKVDATLGSRPLYRDDIFYAGSVNKLPQYTSQISGLEYTLSVTRLPTWNDVNEEAEKACHLCPEAVRRALATLLDTSVLLSPTFLLLAISSSITMMGFFVPFMFITDRATNLGGMEPGTATLLISAIGVTNTVGRVLCGLVTSTLPKGLSALLINNVALTVGGLATIASGYSFSVAYQFGYAAVFGLAISCFASLRSILIVDLIGLEKLTNAFGLLLLFQGLSAVVGAPLAGLLTDLMGSYNASFYFSGTLILISGIMCYPLNRVNAWEKQRRQQNSPKVV